MYEKKDLLDVHVAYYNCENEKSCSNLPLYNTDRAKYITNISTKAKFIIYMCIPLLGMNWMP